MFAALQHRAYIGGHVQDRSRAGGRRLVLYDAYELQRSLLGSASNWAAIGAELLNNPALPMGYFGTGPIIASALQVFAHLYEERGKPAFNIASLEVDGR
jgi:poly(3-hydroxybutyrate) depolymerase